MSTILTLKISTSQIVWKEENLKEGTVDLCLLFTEHSSLESVVESGPMYCSLL